MVAGGANLALSDGVGNTPLHYVCGTVGGGNLVLFKMLLQHRASANHKNKNGDTPLHVALGNCGNKVGALQ